MQLIIDGKSMTHCSNENKTVLMLSGYQVKKLHDDPIYLLGHNNIPIKYYYNEQSAWDGAFYRWKKISMEKNY